MARFGDFQRSSQRLMRLGFVPIGYTDSRRRRLYANPIRVRQGDARPWASVGASGDVEYYASKPADGNTGANGAPDKEASMMKDPTSGELVYLREVAGGPRYETSEGARSRARNGCLAKGLIERRPGRGYALTERGRLWTFAVAKEPTS